VAASYLGSALGIDHVIYPMGCGIMFVVFRKH
jgi:hypothetical protein